MGIFGDASRIQIFAFIVLIASLIFYTVGFAAPYWLYFKSHFYYIGIGLWQTCFHGYHKDGYAVFCSQGTKLQGEGWFELVQVYSCLGLFCLFAAVVCSALKMFILKDRKWILLACIGITFAGAFCIRSSVVIFTANMIRVSRMHFSFAFAFCIIGMIAAVIAGVLNILVQIKEEAK